MKGDGLRELRPGPGLRERGRPWQERGTGEASLGRGGRKGGRGGGSQRRGARGEWTCQVGGGLKREVGRQGQVEGHAEAGGKDGETPGRVQRVRDKGDRDTWRQGKGPREIVCGSDRKPQKDPARNTESQKQVDTETRGDQARETQKDRDVSRDTGMRGQGGTGDRDPDTQSGRERARRSEAGAATWAEPAPRRRGRPGAGCAIPDPLPWSCHSP